MTTKVKHVCTYVRTVWVTSYMCVLLLTGKELPGQVGLAEVGGSLQNPEVRSGRVGELYQDVGHVEELRRHTEEE